MSWSKVNKPFQKPVLWWYHKILCEIGYVIEKNIHGVFGMRMYYKHLNRLCDLGFNLYGEKFKTIR